VYFLILIFTNHSYCKNVGFMKYSLCTQVLYFARFYDKYIHKYITHLQIPRNSRISNKVLLRSLGEGGRNILAPRIHFIKRNEIPHSLQLSTWSEISSEMQLKIKNGTFLRATFFVTILFIIFLILFTILPLHIWYDLHINLSHILVIVLLKVDNSERDQHILFDEFLGNLKTNLYVDMYYNALYYFYIILYCIYIVILQVIPHNSWTTIVTLTKLMACNGSILKLLPLIILIYSNILKP